MTEERAAQKRLEESERRNQLFFSQSQVGIIRRRISDRTIIEVNDRMAQMRGFPTAGEYLKARDYQSAVHMNPEDLADLNRHIAAGKPLDGREFAIERADGGTTWLRAYLVPYPEEDYYELVAVDVSAEREARRRLEESERRNRSLFENALVGIIRLRLDDASVVELNDRMAQLIGDNDAEARSLRLGGQLPNSNGSRSSPVRCGWAPTWCSPRPS